MNRSRFQFKLSFLFSLGIAVSLVVAFLTNASSFSLAALLLGCIIVLVLNFTYYRNVPVLVGAAIGVFFVSVLTLCLIVTSVIGASRTPGEDYYQSEPVEIYCILWLFGSFAAAWFGMLVGLVIEFFVQQCRIHSRDAN